MLTPYEPTTLGHTLIALAFYVAMAIFVIYSIVAIYALIRYGRSKPMALGIILLYVIMTISLYIAALDNLHKIKI